MKTKAIRFVPEDIEYITSEGGGPYFHSGYTVFFVVKKDFVFVYEIVKKRLSKNGKCTILEGNLITDLAESYRLSNGYFPVNCPNIYHESNSGVVPIAEEQQFHNRQKILEFRLSEM